MTDSNMADVTLASGNSHDSVPKKTTKKRKEMNMPSIGSCKVEMLEEDNWFSWRAKMESLLKSHGVKGHIDGTDPKPTTDDEDIEMWEKEDSIAQSILLHQEKWFLPFLALYPNRDSMGYISIYMRYSCNLSDIELDFHYIL